MSTTHTEQHNGEPGMLSNAYEKTKEVAAATIEKTKELGSAAGEKIADAYHAVVGEPSNEQKAADTVKDAAHTAADKIGDAKDKVKNTYHDMTHKSTEDKAADKVSDWADKAADKCEDARKECGKKMEKAGDKMKGN